MNYYKGNVIEKRDIIFKDTYTPDPKGKHPVMIALVTSEELDSMYFLTLSSNVNKYWKHPELQDKYYLLKKTNYNMLKKTSLINLESIYKTSITNEIPVAFVQPDELKKIIRKFKDYQSVHTNEYYNEIKDLI